MFLSYLIRILQFSLYLLTFASLSFLPAASAEKLQTYYNPVLPGWHSDPSCVNNEGTFFCVTSTFLAFPGLPVYASNDLLNWRLASHAWNRDSQLHGWSWNTTGAANGMYAPTIRHHEGIFYVICAYVGLADNPIGVLFKTVDPFDNSKWSDPVILDLEEIDPDLFWDEDWKTYVATAGIKLHEADLTTGELGAAVSIWNGTGGSWPEGPHLYKKDGWYYLLIAEGGTSQMHAITIARSKSIRGPFEPCPDNPILTNRNTEEFFQSVGHGDLFQDEAGNWWGLCLAIRSGPQYAHMPMGREAVLFNVTWDKDEWPQLESVRGRMSGHKLPVVDSLESRVGPSVDESENINFINHRKIPPHFVHNRLPPPNAFSLTQQGLRIRPTRANLTGQANAKEKELTGQNGLGFIGRRQTHTVFDYSINLDFNPYAAGQEAGITVFRSQNEHIDLTVIYLPKGLKGEIYSGPVLRLAEINPTSNSTAKVVELPPGWIGRSLTLRVRADNGSKYIFTVSTGGDSYYKEITMGEISSSAVSGRGSASFFTGTLLGAFATCNGRGIGRHCDEKVDVHITNWTYEGLGQQIDFDEVVPVSV